MVYWIMSPTAEGATLSRGREDQTYEERLVAGSLPERSFSPATAAGAS